MSERRLLDRLPLISFEQALEQYPTIIDTSNYIRQIDAYLEFFPKDHFLFLVLDDLKLDPAGVLAKVSSFLRVAPLNLLNQGLITSNEAGSNLDRHEAQRRIDDFRRLPFLSLIAAVTPHILKRIARRIAVPLLVDSKLPQSTAAQFRRELAPLMPATRAKLLRVLDRPTRRLEAFLSRDLPEWHR